MLNNLSGPFKTGDARDCRYVAVIPFHAEFKVLIRVEARWVNWKFGHAAKDITYTGHRESPTVSLGRVVNLF
jgi:hypothetical protein